MNNGISTVSTYILRIGWGFDGVVKESYHTYRYLKVPSVYHQAGIAMDQTLYPCWESPHETDPHCIYGGCGNGLVNSALDTSTEQCDDANNVDGDG